MKSTQTIIDDLLESWGFYKNNKERWHKNKKYILETLIPSVANGSCNYKKDLTELEAEAFVTLHKILTEKEWKNISDLFNLRIEHKNIESEKEKAKRIEEEARRKEEEKATRIEEEALELQRKEQAKLEKEEMDRLEAERERKQIQIAALRKCFEKDFLNSDSVYKRQFVQIFTHDEYEAEKISFVKEWIKNNTGNEVDNEQAFAIASLNKNIQVVARAGSGKTSTVINRTIFLHKHLGVPADQIILLAFNKKAAEEMQERLTKYFDDTPPTTLTFHTLAYRNVLTTEKIVYDGDNESSQSQIIQTIIDDHLRSAVNEKEIRKIMLRHFKDELDAIAGGKYDKSKEEFLDYRRSLSYQTLNNEYVKSPGEKRIANFLFEHGLVYEYEKGLYWQGTPYRPDFTLLLENEPDVIIEYFGITNNEKYDQERIQKINFWKGLGKNKFIDIYPGETVSNLKAKLNDLGISFDRLSEDEIWEKVKTRAIDRFSKVTRNFIGRLRQLNKNPSEIDIDRLDDFSENDKDFIDVMKIIYEAYIDYLSNNEITDFSGLLINAVDNIKAGNMLIKEKGETTCDLNKIKYMFIDEYQDFSKSFFELIKTIKTQNKDIELFCVGDDWQAINMFAGSDLSYYQDFEKHFNNSSKLKITTNYRSAYSIVNLSNDLMKNEEGSPAQCHQSSLGDIFLCKFDQAPQSSNEIALGIDKIESLALRLIKNAIENKKEIVFLVRNNRIPYATKNKSEPYNFLKKIRSYFNESDHKKINISTIHQFKGKESDVVVLLDLRSNQYPSIHPDWKFNKIFGDNIPRLIDEERRLLYVALTRPLSSLILLVENINDPSPFLEDILSQKRGVNKRLKMLDWKNYPQTKLNNNSNLLVSFSSGTYAIKDKLNRGGFSYSSEDRSWTKNYSANEYSMTELTAKIQNLLSNFKNKEIIKVKIVSDTEIVTNEIKQGQWQSWKTNKIIE